MRVGIKTKCKYVLNMITLLQDVVNEARSIKDTVVFDLDYIDEVVVKE